jgi:beta-lactamase regulating signal transducer with metallopeptidase domain/biopolymer transport protein ExbD
MVEATITLLNEWAGTWGPYLLLAVIQNTVFLAVVFLGLHLMRGAAARVLSLIATVGVIKLAIPPFLPLAWLTSQPAEQVVRPVTTLLFPFSETAGGDRGFTAGITGGLSPAALLMMIWVSIALARLGYGLLQTLQLAMDIRTAERVDDRELPVEIRQAGLSVWQSSRISLPLTLGIRPRRIFVPASWDSWSAACRRSALLHELAHVRRRDGIMQTVEIIVQAVFFFLPPVTWLVRRLHAYREMACDDASVATDPRSRLDYSRFLCSLAESMLEGSPATASASPLARRKGELLDRVAYQVKEGAVKRTNKKQLILVLAVLVFSALPLSMVYGGKPKAAPAPPSPPKAPAKTSAVAPVAPVADVAMHIPEDVPKKKEKMRNDVPPPPPPAVQVSITADERLLVNGKPVKAKEFKKAVKSAVGKQGGKTVINIDSDGGITMKQLHDVQGDLKEMGLLRILYSGELGKAVPMFCRRTRRVRSWRRCPRRNSSAYVSMARE